MLTELHTDAFLHTRLLNLSCPASDIAFFLFLFPILVSFKRAGAICDNSAVNSRSKEPGPFHSLTSQPISRITFTLEARGIAAASHSFTLSLLSPDRKRHFDKLF
jgi:hypothetical protein